MNSAPDYLRRREGYLLFLGAIVVALVIAPMGAWLIWPRAPKETAERVTVFQAPGPAPVSVGPAAPAPRSYRDAVDKAAPSVVNVYTAKRMPARRYDNP